MFRSAVLKLTAWYVGALCLVCLVFSLPLYNVASTRLRRGAERQTEVVRQLPEKFIPNSIVPMLERQRERQLDDDRRELLNNFILTNLMIIGAGAVASYLFARRTLRPLEQAHAAQAKFTANASHELRTPLAVMQTEIDVALRNKNMSIADAREILASNLEEVERLRTLSDRLLSLTRSTGDLKRKSIKLDAVIQSELKRLTKRHKKPITSEIARDVMVSGDATLLRQVLNILVDNAFAYSGVEVPDVNVVLKQKDDVVTLTVSDKGVGIQPFDLGHIFDRFYRGTDSETVKPEGHGLGLSLARDIIERHDGTITARSKPGKGSSFIISLPRI
jgi:signal transduction histidine kinase